MASRAAHRLTPISFRVTTVLNNRIEAVTTAAGGVSHTMTTVPALEGLEPEALWRYFGALTQLPRPSKHEGR